MHALIREYNQEAYAESFKKPVLLVIALVELSRIIKIEKK